ncbi:hypothetical protein ACFSTC_11025 [Nonomuraea ferruginea]
MLSALEQRAAELGFRRLSGDTTLNQGGPRWCCTSGTGGGRSRGSRWASSLSSTGRSDCHPHLLKFKDMSEKAPVSGAFSF